MKYINFVILYYALSTVLQLDTTNLNLLFWILLFQTQNHIPWIFPFSHLLRPYVYNGTMRTDDDDDFELPLFWTIVGFP